MTVLAAWLALLGFALSFGFVLYLSVGSPFLLIGIAVMFANLTVLFWLATRRA